MAAPMGDEPVKLIMLTPGEATSAAGTSGPDEVRTLTTPGGKPASVMARPSRRMPSGSWGAGLMMQVLPIASAGAILPATFTSGKL